MTARYQIIDEPNTGECEIEYFKYQRRCNKAALKAIVDTADKTDPTYPGGFHCAHVCAEHATLAWLLMEHPMVML